MSYDQRRLPLAGTDRFQQCRWPSGSSSIPAADTTAALRDFRRNIFERSWWH